MLRKTVDNRGVWAKLRPVRLSHVSCTTIVRLPMLTLRRNTMLLRLYHDNHTVTHGFVTVTHCIATIATVNYD